MPERYFNKNAFLYEVGAFVHSFSLNLYGNGFEINQAKGKEHFNYMGFVKSDDLIATAQEILAWYGTALLSLPAPETLENICNTTILIKHPCISGANCLSSFGIKLH